MTSSNSSTPPSHNIQFKEFVLNPQTRTLVKGNSQLAASDKTIALLLLLLEQHSASKDELLEKL